ncbi:Cmc1p NDAI_0E01990 [Naumovozyma dairenensis CBS 421]|uniref:COX assembly mitochondrial protein n=1 Tax=Naumovozyma dairenensis (strain ATCC 10597 / BCRC 20456 / CBS 421 / NBRC 0211 / NRRL Y-12639) TaxID=1071378 RepID=G0WB95_NAUDC|nr:hypothetical protein NDAI_0E01990 [Naumovozyma dairenensis CBS 421]CCD25015.1 hypothetical protein NDAI_0E01990 [Naumovozyma dairenensis CBS 421]
MEAIMPEEPKTSISNHNSKVPIWALSATDERTARKNLKAFTYQQCHEYVKAMADCAKLNGIKVFPNCDPEKAKMKNCLLFYQNDSKYLDDERDKLILERINKLEEQFKQGKK